MDVTLAWMAGVVAMMGTFGVIALVGYFKKSARDAAANRPH